MKYVPSYVLDTWILNTEWVVVPTFCPLEMMLTPARSDGRSEASSIPGSFPLVPHVEDTLVFQSFLETLLFKLPTMFFSNHSLHSSRLASSPNCRDKTSKSDRPQPCARDRA